MHAIAVDGMELNGMGDFKWAPHYVHCTKATLNALYSFMTQLPKL